MTEADFLENANANFDLVIQILSLYLTATSAYLIVAFMVGDKLTNLQTIIISTLFIFMAAMATYGMYAWLSRAFFFIDEARALDKALPIYSRSGLAIALAIVLAGGIIASLKFMWDVRHDKTE